MKTTTFQVGDRVRPADTNEPIHGTVVQGFANRSRGPCVHVLWDEPGCRIPYWYRPNELVKVAP